MVAKAPVGQSATVSVLRDGKELEIDAILSPIPESQQAMKSPAPNPKAGHLGLRLSALDDETRDALRYEGDGVLIQEVMPSSPAARQGLRAGDIILKVGNAPVSTPQDVVGEVKKLKPAKRPVLLLVQREGNQRYVALKTG